VIVSIASLSQSDWGAAPKAAERLRIGSTTRELDPGNAGERNISAFSDISENLFYVCCEGITSFPVAFPAIVNFF